MNPSRDKPPAGLPDGTIVEAHSAAGDGSLDIKGLALALKGTGVGGGDEILDALLDPLGFRWDAFEGLLAACLEKPYVLCVDPSLAWGKLREYLKDGVVKAKPGTARWEEFAEALACACERLRVHPCSFVADRRVLQDPEGDGGERSFHPKTREKILKMVTDSCRKSTSWNADDLLNIEKRHRDGKPWDPAWADPLEGLAVLAQTCSGYGLDISEAYGLKSVGGGLHVGALCFRDCWHLAELGDGVRVDGHFLVQGPHRLKELPDSLAVREWMSIDMGRVERFRGKWSAKKAELHHPGQLADLGHGVVGDYFRLCDCPKLETIGSLEVRDSFELVGRSLRNLGPLRVDQSADLHEVHLLVSLDDAVVGGDLSLKEARSLEAIGPGVEVGGWLKIEDAARLNGLPDGLKIGGLWLKEVPSLKALPDGMKLGLGLYLEECPGLERLPRGLEMDGDLVVVGCPKWDKEIPADAVLGGRVITDEFPDGVAPDKYKKWRENERGPAGMDHKALSLSLLATGMDRKDVFLARAGTVLAPLLESWMRAQLDAGVSEADVLVAALYDTGIEWWGNCRSVWADVFEKVGFERWWADGGLHLRVQRSVKDDQPVGPFKITRLDVGPGCPGGRLPKGLRVNGSQINLPGWVDFEGFPEGFSAQLETWQSGCGLCLVGCKNLKSLPDGLKTAGIIDLNGCESLVRLPKGLKAKDLDMRGCTNWDGIVPEDAVIDETIQTDFGRFKLSEWRQKFGSGSCPQRVKDGG